MTSIKICLYLVRILTILRSVLIIIEEIKKIENSLNRIFGSVALKYGLTGKQFFILGFILRQSKKREITQKDIENFGNVRKSSVSSIISNLEKNHFIVRKSSEKDSRVNILLPTEQAYEIERKINIKRKKVENEIFSCFSEQDLEKCGELLTELQKKLKEIANRD